MKRCFWTLAGHWPDDRPPLRGSVVRESCPVNVNDIANIALTQRGRDQGDI